MGEWSLFLDRDGVLNRRVPDGYVLRVEELEVIDGAPEALAVLAPLARRVVVVTNQAGVGKGLMTAEALDDIHGVLVERLTRCGGRIDAVLACPHRAEVGCGCRKPAPGMAWQALGRFPDIELTRSVMVGDSLSDCQFADAVGMRSVFIGVRSWDGVPQPWQVASDLVSAVPHLATLMRS